MRQARADPLRRLLDRKGPEVLLDREGFATLDRLGFERPEAKRALDDLAERCVVEFAGDWPMLFVRLRGETT